MMIVPELWREAARHPGGLVASAALLVALLATHIAQAVLVAWAMSAVVEGRAHDVAVAAGGVLLIALGRVLLSLAQTGAAAHLGGRVRLSLRRRATQAALVPTRLHDVSVRDGSMRAILSDGIDGTDAYVARYIPAVTQVLVACPLIVGAVALVEPLAGAAVGAAVVLALAGPLGWRRVMTRRGLDHWDSYECLSADLLEALRGMATLRALGDVPATRRRLHERSEELRAATEKVMRVSLAETGITDLAIQGGVVAAAAAACAHAATGHAPAFEVYLLLLLASEAFRPVRDLSRHWHAGFLGLTAVPGLVDVGAFDNHEDQHSWRPATFARPQEVDVDEVFELRARGLHYRYPGAERPVFVGLDLTATRGRLTVVVGESGAGKSTLFDVLLGFLQPTAGTVTLDGRALRRDDVAVVSQRPVLFAGTIRDNLVVAGAQRAPGSLTDEELARACRAAGILDEIEALPAGLDTDVAEAGSSLSGGQRQRLALARALLARRPVLLVDEPTSALDIDRAHDVVRTLHRAAKERVVIMVSHRLETHVDVDAELLLEAGRLTEVGT